MLDKCRSVCYYETVAGACAQAFRCGRRYPSANTHPADVEPVTDFAHRAIHTAQATSDYYKPEGCLDNQQDAGDDFGTSPLPSCVPMQFSGFFLYPEMEVKSE